MSGETVSHAQTVQVHHGVDLHVDVDVALLLALLLLRRRARLEHAVPHVSLRVTTDSHTHVAPGLVVQEAEEREEVVDRVLERRAANHPVDRPAQGHDRLVHPRSTIGTCP